VSRRLLGGRRAKGRPDRGNFIAAASRPPEGRSERFVRARQDRRLVGPWDTSMCVTLGIHE
jgi:hypothetical protein